MLRFKYVLPMQMCSIYWSKGSNRACRCSRPARCYRSYRPTGATGPTGVMGPTGAAGEAPDDIFASYAAVQSVYNNGDLITLYPAITDPTGNITATDLTHITLAAGYYLISYKVSVIFLRRIICRLLRRTMELRI